MHNLMVIHAPIHIHTLALLYFTYIHNQLIVASLPLNDLLCVCAWWLCVCIRFVCKCLSFSMCLPLSVYVYVYMSLDFVVFGSSEYSTDRTTQQNSFLAG